jgi:hypothetical protein
LLPYTGLNRLGFVVETLYVLFEVKVKFILQQATKTQRGVEI